MLREAQDSAANRTGRVCPPYGGESPLFCRCPNISSPLENIAITSPPPVCPAKIMCQVILGNSAGPQPWHQTGSRQIRGKAFPHVQQFASIMQDDRFVNPWAVKIVTR